MHEFPKAGEVWEDVSGALVRGLVHALNNRIATIEGVAATLEDDDNETISGHLRSEGERLRTLTETARHLAVERSAGAETCTLADVLSAAMQLASMHPDLRDLSVDLRGAENMPALRLRLRRAQHAMLLGLLAASRDGGGGDALVALCTETPDERAEILLRPLKKRGGTDAEPEVTEALCAAADAMLHGDGGEVELQARSVRSVAVRLPSLAFAKRKEREPAA